MHFLFFFSSTLPLQPSPPPPSLLQGANEAGNAPLNPDPRHTPGCGFDPATGAVATAFTPADASVQYDPVTQTVAVEELSEFNKDSIPLNLPAGYTAGEQPHAAPDLGEEEGKKKE